MKERKILSKKPIFKKWWIWTIIGVVIMGAIVGIIITLPSSNQQNELINPESISNITDLSTCEEATEVIKEIVK